MSFPIIQPFEKRPLAKVLEIPLLPLVARRGPFRQLEYVREYVSDLDCSAIMIEAGYVDRDYMQDHSVFYSTSFVQYPAVCRRVHFFKNIASDDLLAAFTAVTSERQKSDDAYATACHNFSESKYLGFAVIKPLPGSPLGRTVLKTFPLDTPGRNFTRGFDATRVYTTHLLGIRLDVRGLAFQQQDEGVSACATTAVWSSLQKLRDSENVAPATPAQITAGASRFALPFGRSMPSEGLSLDQMCQAIHGLGLAPNLVRIPSFITAQSILHVAGQSGIASILIIQRQDIAERHAVTAAGVKLRRDHVAPKAGASIDDLSSDLIGLYVHDDRIGPYLRTRLEGPEVDVDGKKRRVPIVAIEKHCGDAEEWLLTHLLLPVHGKIRLSIVQLVQFANEFGTFAHAALLPLGVARAPVSISTRIVRGYVYIEQLLTDGDAAAEERRRQVFSAIRLSRYVGVTRVSVPAVGNCDVLVDTTGTARNAHCLGIVCRSQRTERSTEFVAAFGKKFDCCWIS